jgi:hypothetical protein
MHCMHCGTETETFTPTCPGCGRGVIQLGGDTPWHQLRARAELVVGEEAREGFFAIRTEDQGGGLRITFFFQPRGAKSAEDVTFFVDEIVQAGLPRPDFVMDSKESVTFARVANMVADLYGGVGVLRGGTLLPAR